MNSTLRCFALLLPALTLAGCASTAGKGPEKPPTAFGCPVANRAGTAMEDLISAKVETAGRLADVAVKGITCSQRNDALRIDIELANSADMTHRIAYRFRWLDRDGLAAWEEESLKPVLLYPRSAQQLVGYAPTAKAVDFRFFLMPQDQ